MTKGEVADFLEKCRWWFEPYTSEKEKWNEALDMAVEALTQESRKVTQESTQDLINRQDIKYHVQLEAMGNGQYEEVEIAYKNDIESLPSADAVSKGVFDQFRWERDMAFKTLEEHGIGLGEIVYETTENKSKLDLISRQDAIDAVGRFRNIDGISVWHDGIKESIRIAIIEDLAKLPSADRPTVDKEYLVDLIQEAVYDGEACAKLMDMVDRPTGEWIEVNHVVDTTCECSECHHRDYTWKPERTNMNVWTGIGLK